MRLFTFTAACLAGIAGFATLRSRPAVAIDEHAGHSGHAMATTGVALALQDMSIPASNVTAAERLAKSPRHGEWVSIKVGATDSLTAWVV